MHLANWPGVVEPQQTRPSYSSAKSCHPPKLAQQNLERATRRSLHGFLVGVVFLFFLECLGLASLPVVHDFLWCPQVHPIAEPFFLVPSLSLSLSSLSLSLPANLPQAKFLFVDTKRQVFSFAAQVLTCATKGVQIVRNWIKNGRANAGKGR